MEHDIAQWHQTKNDNVKWLSGFIKTKFDRYVWLGMT